MCYKTFLFLLTKKHCRVKIYTCIFYERGMFMGDKLKEHRKQNIDKIRIGTCIELLLLLDNFESDFSRLHDFITENAEFLTNQMESTISKQFQDIQEVLTNDIDILLNDIDKEEIYCQYLGRYY